VTQRSGWSASGGGALRSSSDCIESLQKKIDERVGEMHMNMRRVLVPKRGGGGLQICWNRKDLAVEERFFSEKSCSSLATSKGEKESCEGGVSGLFMEGIT
jgi:hypothetical protein